MVFCLFFDLFVDLLLLFGLFVDLFNVSLICCLFSCLFACVLACLLACVLFVFSIGLVSRGGGVFSTGLLPLGRFFDRFGFWGGPFLLDLVPWRSLF